MDRKGITSRNSGGEGSRGRHGESRTILVGIASVSQSATYDEPLQEPPEAGPATTSQYVPAGKDVLKVPLQVESPLLITTNPVDPNRNMLFSLRSITVRPILTSAKCNLLRRPRDEVCQTSRY